MLIDGAAVDSIAAFYAQLNEKLMRGEDWEIGPSLDALNDLLYSGIGALAGAGRQRWVITDHTDMAAALGVETTRAWLRAKLDPEGPFDRPAIREQLERPEASGHATYFELLLEVFADHPAIELVLN